MGNRLVEGVALPRRATPPEWVCPDHRRPLEPRHERLVCPSDHSWPVRGGIARFVPDGSYASAFGTQWKRYPRTQLDSHSGLPISEERLRRCIGEQLWAELRELDVLEVGCGAGRFTEPLLYTEARVTSVDLSEAVEVNAANFPTSPQHRVAQADAQRLPFVPGQFDVVLCLGVVQHTPDTEKTLAALAEHVRPGGHLVVDHYVRTWRWYTRTAPLVRQVLKRLPPEKGLVATELLVDVFRPLHQRVRGTAGRVLLNRVSPVTVYDDVYPQLGENLLREWALLDTHDMLTDWYKHRRSVEEVRGALERLGLVEIWVAPGGNGVEARARRPA